MKPAQLIYCFVLAGGVALSACTTLDNNSEEAAVKRLVASEGPLEQNVDPNFEGEAYDQDGQQVVCKKTKVTGSRIGQYTVCRTEEDWNNTQDESVRRLQRMQDAGGAFCETCKS